MIRMMRPAIRATMGWIWAAVMVIGKVSAARFGKMSNRGGEFNLSRGSTIEDAQRFAGFRGMRKMPKIAALRHAFSGNDASRDGLGRIAAGAPRHASLLKEFSMRNKILAIAAIAGAVSAPIAAQAQSETVGVARGSGVAVTETDPIGIVPDQRSAFRDYVIRERVPTYTIP